MSSLPPEFWRALTLLARAADQYRKATQREVVVVGGAAVSFYTQGEILSGDFDLVTDIGFETFLLAEGFEKERGPGRLLGGYYHPAVPKYGFEFVSGQLYDGLSDRDKLLAVAVTDDHQIVFASVEDLIADRLGQFASNNKDGEMLAQAKLLFALAPEYDPTYLKRRIVQDSGDPALLGLV